MGQSNSQYSTKCNALCPLCMCVPNAIPNIAGRFFIINNHECQCNACNSIFEKTLFYKSAFIIANATPHIENDESESILVAPLAQVIDRNTILDSTSLVKAYLVEQKSK